MKKALHIVKKELDKIFRNPRLIFSTFILPGLLIFVIYSVMGNVSATETTEIASHTNIVYVINAPDDFKEYMTNEVKFAYNISPTYCESAMSESDLASADVTTAIEEELYDAIIFFPTAFVANYQANLTATPETLIKNDIQVVYSDEAKYATTATASVNALIGQYRDFILVSNGNNPNIFTTVNNNLASGDSGFKQVLSMLLPVFVIIFVFAGGLSVGSDAIAGEKERGTISTMLMAPISKNQIVLGKIISTTIITLLSALGSSLGVVLALPRMGSMFGTSVTVSYDITTYLLILVLVMVIALVATGFFLLASTVAKSTKEASMYAMPIYIIAMVLAYVSAFNSGLPTDLWQYCIPIYNVALGLKGLMMQQLQIVPFILIVASNLVCCFLCLILASRLFKNERLMFSK